MPDIASYARECTKSLQGENHLGNQNQPSTCGDLLTPARMAVRFLVQTAFVRIGTPAMQQFFTGL